MSFEDSVRLITLGLGTVLLGAAAWIAISFKVALVGALVLWGILCIVAALGGPPD